LGEYNIKNEKLLDGLNNRLDTAEEKIKEPKGRTIDSIQLKKRKNGQGK